MKKRTPYYNMYNRNYSENIKSCFYSFIGIVICLILIFLFSGCKTKSFTSDTETKDSVRVEYKEKIVKVPVTVYVEVPVEKQEKETSDTVSKLKTSFAKSTAKIEWKNNVPILFHSLENIPQTITCKDTAQITEKETIKYKYLTRTKIVKEEKRLSKLNTIYLYLGKIFFVVILILLALGILYISRNRVKKFFS